MSLRTTYAALGLALPLMIASTARAAEIKLGYIDLQRALLEVDEGRAAKARLQSMLEGKQKELDKEQEGLRKEKDQLDKQASTMPEETRVKKMTDLQKKMVEFAQRFEKNKVEMDAKQRTELQSIFTKMDPIIAAIAQREGITMMFEKTDSGLVYAPSSLDFTNDLVRLYNDKNKGKGGAGAAAAPKDAPKPEAKKDEKK
jgi:outer membrane protein